MKFAFYLFLLMNVACKFHEGSGGNLAETAASHTVSQSKGFARTLFENGLAKFTAIFKVFDPPSLFCQAVIKDSPTREDYIRNWQPHDEVNFCPGGSHILESCQKKHNDAFEAGLACYKSSILPIEN